MIAELAQPRGGTQTFWLPLHLQNTYRLLTIYNIVTVRFQQHTRFSAVALQVPPSPYITVDQKILEMGAKIAFIIILHYIDNA